MNKNNDFLANENIMPRHRLPTYSSSKRYLSSNSRSSSPIQKLNPKNSTPELSIFDENPDLKSSNLKTKIHCSKSEIITENEESVLAKGVWSLFNKTNNISIENPSLRLDKKNGKTINVKVLAERKVSEDNENTRPLKDITTQVLPSIPQLETPVQEILKSLYISPNINVSQRENNYSLEPESNIREMFSSENPDMVQIANHVVRESDEGSEDKENENAGSLNLSESNFNVDSFNLKHTEIIYPPSFFVRLLDDPESSVTLEEFHMLLNNYAILWNRKDCH